MQQVKTHPIDPQEIRETVESGEYFATARKWYDDLYHRPLAERSYFVVITLMAGLTIFISLMVYASLFPLTRAVPYTILSQDEESDDVPYITPLRQAIGEDLNVSIARFLLGNYVTAREKYKYDVVEVERQFNRIRATSGENVLNQFLAELDASNPSSPVNKYGRDTERMVRIDKVVMNMEATPPQAQVYFATNLAKGASQQVNQWLATIAFRLPLLKVDQQVNMVLQWNEQTKEFELAENIAFEVVDYKTQEIGSSVP